MQSDQIEAPSFDEATKNGEIIDKSGYHKPDVGTSSYRCSCTKTTEKGAYRDVTVKMPGGRTVYFVYFYHQSPVVVEVDGRFRIDNFGYETSTTKQRINDYIPSGFTVYQQGGEWFLKTYDPDVPFDEREYERREFENGMILEP
jgi:hypothetical protein